MTRRQHPGPCPFCQGEPKLVDSAEIYGRSYGWAWRCYQCDAYVGCHRGTTDPLGTLADAATREARGKAHAAFDPLWQRLGKGDGRRRRKTYQWLATELGIDEDECHIAMFDAATCQRVVELCNQRREDG